MYGIVEPGHVYKNMLSEMIDALNPEAVVQPARSLVTSMGACPGSTSGWHPFLKREDRTNGVRGGSAHAVESYLQDATLVSSMS